MIKQIICLVIGLALMNSANAQDYCWKQTQTRGVGTIPTDCAYDQQKQGLLCYPKCKAGFTGIASVCWQDCPAGFTDDGAFCRKASSYGRGAGFAWQAQDGISNAGMLSRCQAVHGNCEMWGAMAYPICKPGFYAAGANICAQNCPAGMTDIGVSCTKQTFMRATIGGQCPAGTNYEDGLCYRPCNAGFKGSGPVCGQVCPANMPWSCGAGCAKNYEACAVATSDQVLNVLSVVGDIALLVTTAGIGNAAKMGTKTVALNATEAGIKAAIKASIKELAQGLSKTLSKETFKRVIREKMPNILDSTLENLYETLAVQGTTAFAAQLDKEFPPDFDFYSLDPTGIASIVKAYNHSVCAAPPPTAPETGSGSISSPAPTNYLPGTWGPAGSGALTDAVDISAGKDGTVWVVKSNIVARLKPGETYFTPVPGMGLPGTPLKRVAALDATQAWILTGNPTTLATIYRFDNGTSAWIKVPGSAVDIAVDSVGNLYAIGSDNGLFKLRVGDTVWSAMPHLPNGQRPMSIGAGGVEQVWVTTADSTEFKWENGNWAPGGIQRNVKDVSVGPDGAGWFSTGTGNVAVWRDGTTKELPSNGMPTAVSVGGNGKVFAIVGGKAYKFSTPQ